MAQIHFMCSPGELASILTLGSRVTLTHGGKWLDDCDSDVRERIAACLWSIDRYRMQYLSLFAMCVRWLSQG
jgi:hypothetical protein